MAAHDSKSLTTAQRAVRYADALKAAGYTVHAVKISGRDIEIVTVETNAPVNTADLVSP